MTTTTTYRTQLLALPDDDIDQMVADELDTKSDELWEQGVREKVGDEEFERLYPKAQTETSKMTTTDYRLQLPQDDRHDPEVAHHVIAAIASLDDESARITITLAAMGMSPELN